jgi:hypothetical protein
LKSEKAKVVSNSMAREGFGCRRLSLARLLLPIAFSFLSSWPALPQGSAVKPPQTLQETGLYSDFRSLKIDSKHLAFSPQYPLWSDGAAKRRWISLPSGAAINGSAPDAWTFPVGTRLWKEFSFNSQRVETRYMERRYDGQWLYAAYAWNLDGREARLVSDRGQRGAHPLAMGRAHTIPGVSDCKVCHQGGSAEVLGFSAFQLSPDRDPGAVHAEPLPAPGVDLRYLVDNGLLVGLPRTYQKTPPRIESGTATERSALGYMHGNCGHCHNEQGSLANLQLFLRQAVTPTAHTATISTIRNPVKKLAPGQPADAVLRIEPGNPDRSGLMKRIDSRYPPLQMPPLGTELVDEEAVSLIRKWIAELDEPGKTINQEEGDVR